MIRTRSHTTAVNHRPAPASVRHHDGLTPLALAAGLAFGHFVQAMAESGQPGAVTMFSALVFVIAASAGTLCALVSMASHADAAGARARIPGWLLAMGAGLLGALAPALL